MKTKVDTTGFSRVVLQLQPKGKLTMTGPDTTGFSRVVLQLQPYEPSPKPVAFSLVNSSIRAKANGCSSYE